VSRESLPCLPVPQRHRTLAVHYRSHTRVGRAVSTGTPKRRRSSQQNPLPSDRIDLAEGFARCRPRRCVSGRLLVAFQVAGDNEFRGVLAGMIAACDSSSERRRTPRFAASNPPLHLAWRHRWRKTAACRVARSSEICAAGQHGAACASPMADGAARGRLAFSRRQPRRRFRRGTRMRICATRRRWCSILRHRARDRRPLYLL
jgi:hypothetical protein